MDGIPKIGKVGGLDELGPATRPSKSAGGGFADVLKDAIDTVDGLQKESEAAQKAFATGEDVELHDVLQFGNRVGLLMAKAGDRTLADRLREEGRLHLELLERFGEDLLTTVDWLEDRVPEATETTPDIRMPTDDGTGNNFRPLAYEGTALTMPSSQPELMLDGTGSRDIDGDIASYGWVQLGGPPVVLDDPTSPTPMFANPGPTDELLFELTVTDDDGAADTVVFALEVVADNVVSKLPGGTAIGPAALLVLLLIGCVQRRRV